MASKFSMRKGTLVPRSSISTAPSTTKIAARNYARSSNRLSQVTGETRAPIAEIENSILRLDIEWVNTTATSRPGIVHLVLALGGFRHRQHRIRDHESFAVLGTRSSDQRAGGRNMS